MNQLQSISTEEHGHLFVTMNPPYEPDESKVISRHQYDHTIVDVKVRAPGVSYMGGVSQAISARASARNVRCMRSKQNAGSPSLAHG